MGTININGKSTTINNIIVKKHSDPTFSQQLCYLKVGNTNVWEGHNDKSVGTTTSTCTVGGKTTYECQRCHRQRQVQHSALGHNWNYSQNTVATLAQDGVVKATCKRDSSHTLSETTTGGIKLTVPSSLLAYVGGNTSNKVYFSLVNSSSVRVRRLYFSDYPVDYATNIPYTYTFRYETTYNKRIAPFLAGSFYCDTKNIGGSYSDPSIMYNGIGTSSVKGWYMTFTIQGFAWARVGDSYEINYSY